MGNTKKIHFSGETKTLPTGADIHEATRGEYVSMASWPGGYLGHEPYASKERAEANKAMGLIFVVGAAHTSSSRCDVDWIGTKFTEWATVTVYDSDAPEVRVHHYAGGKLEGVETWRPA